MSRTHLLRLAVEEENADGKARVETEHVLYARITDLNFLSGAASSEYQEQWEIKQAKTEGNAGSGRFRVRKVVKVGGEPEYFITAKTVDPRTKGSIETTVPCTEAMFTQFKIMSDRGMVKDRYFFPITHGSDTTLKWEVDMFYRQGSQPGSKDYFEWCKIDLETDDMEAPLPPLPEGFTDIIAAPYGKRSEQEEARVTSLYHNEFTTKNMYLSGAA